MAANRHHWLLALTAALVVHGGVLAAWQANTLPLDMTATAINIVFGHPANRDIETRPIAEEQTVPSELAKADRTQVPILEPINIADDIGVKRREEPVTIDAAKPATAALIKPAPVKKTKRGKIITARASKETEQTQPDSKSGPERITESSPLIQPGGKVILPSLVKEETVVNGVSSLANDKTATRPNNYYAASGDIARKKESAQAQASYFALLETWLDQHKKYPLRAKRKRQQGTALLYFVMDRNGQVLEYNIEESSGYKLLDREVSAMIKRAQPLPRIPDAMQQAKLKITVPVEFMLR